jgi:uncharacterized protein (TIGR03437 family)
MPTPKFLRRAALQCMLAIFFLCCLNAQTTITNLTTDFFPSGLIQAPNGLFYGTTQGGGTTSSGTVFSVSTSGTLATIYSFCSQPNCTDGGAPATSANLVLGTDGNFYGTTTGGGLPTTGNSYGEVFQLTPAGVLTTLHAFLGTDGAGPMAGLIQASDGNFYGTASQGGPYNLQIAGTVFKITPAGAFSTVYAFCTGQANMEVASCPDGAEPETALVQGKDGNLYGTTNMGGANDYGTVFKVTPSGTETVLHSFNQTDGSYPAEAPLLIASDGNFWGITGGGGANGKGTIFKMTPAGNLTTVYSFGTTPTDGSSPSSLIQATDGNLYGAASDVFQLTLGGVFTPLTSVALGAEYIVQGSDGNIYGTTLFSIFRLSLGSISPSGPSIAQTGGIVNGASFQNAIASGSWITVTGKNLSSKTDNWGSSIKNGKLPTSLDGVSVSVGGQPAYIAYISPTQINVVAPDIPSGAAQITVTSGGTASAPVTTTVEEFAPAFFQWGAYAVADHEDFTPAVKSGTFPGLTTTPAKPGDVIILWGTGFGPASPAVPEGEETPSGTLYNTANPVSVKVGSKSATVLSAVMAPGFAGLYQVAIQVPQLANGDYPVVATVSGESSPATTLITVQQ